MSVKVRESTWLGRAIRSICGGFGHALVNCSRQYLDVMLGVDLNGLDQFEFSDDIIARLFYPLPSSQYLIQYVPVRKLGIATYLLHIVQLDENLVDFAVGQSAHYVFVLVIGLPPGFVLGTAAGLIHVVLVHKVILVFGVVAAKVDIGESVGDGLVGRGFEVL